MNRDRVLGYAVQVAAFAGGTQYGHMGNEPTAPEELTPQQAECIRGAVMSGRRAAVAREQHEEARAEFEHERFRKSRGVAKLYGFTLSLMGDCYDAGYRSVRSR